MKLRNRIHGAGVEDETAGVKRFSLGAVCYVLAI